LLLQVKAVFLYCIWRMDLAVLYCCDCNPQICNFLAASVPRVFQFLAAKK